MKDPILEAKELMRDINHISHTVPPTVNRSATQTLSISETCIGMMFQNDWPTNWFIGSTIRMDWR